MSTEAMLFAVLCTFAGAIAGLAVGWFAGRGVRRETEADREAALAAALSAALAERAATASAVLADRDRTMRAAVDTAVKIAGARLDDSMKSGSKELELRSHSFEERTAHLTAELVQLRKLVGDLHAERARQHGEVVTRLDQAAKVTTELTRTTNNLREALANSRARGQWGERMAADVLRAAGMVEGVNYRTQTAVASGRVPDFTFLLPRGLELNMDVKFPIDNYLRYLDASSDTDRQAALSAFLRDVRGRVKEITSRDYIDPERTVDQVLLFIPNESVYTFIHENDAELLDRALSQKVVVCSPTTLFAVLAVVRQALENFQFERASSEILTRLNEFRKQWEKFSEQFDKLGRAVDATHRAYDELTGTRRRGLERELDKIEDLHARAGLDGDPPESSFPVRALRAG